MNIKIHDNPVGWERLPDQMDKFDTWEDYRKHYPDPLFGHLLDSEIVVTQRGREHMGTQGPGDLGGECLVGTLRATTASYNAHVKGYVPVADTELFLLEFLYRAEDGGVAKSHWWFCNTGIRLEPLSLLAGSAE